MIEGDPRKRNILSRLIVRRIFEKGLFCPVRENDLPVLEGIRDGSAAFTGPQIVHLDLTNRCNLNCIACWCQSPLLGEGFVDPKQLDSTLSLDIIKSFIDDLAQMGNVDQIKLGGGGEPTMHPDFADILSYLSAAIDAEIDINTNFTLFNDKLIDLVLNSNVSRLTASLWAASGATYRATHPNQSAKTFHRVVENLKKFSANRKNGRPDIWIHNVIMNLNHHEADAMLRLALEIGADKVHFILVDTIPDKTERLLLTARERAAVTDWLLSLEPNMDVHYNYTDPTSGRAIHIVNYHELLSRLSQPGSGSGAYDKKAVERIPCYIGWHFTRILADGRVVPCCKGHRLTLGDLNKDRFRTIWNSRRYNRFRSNGLRLKKSHPYYAAIGNKLDQESGCYNCDNLMHNMVVHRKRLAQGSALRWAMFELAQRYGL